MFQVFYLEDKNYPYHDFILDGYNMEIYEHLMSYFPYPDTVEVGGLTFTGARIILNDYDFINFLKFIIIDGIRWYSLIYKISTDKLVTHIGYHVVQ